MSPITEAPPTLLTPPALLKMDNYTNLIANLPTFNRGEDIRKENPHTFIAKIMVFELFLVEGGLAREWFDKLSGDAKTTWNGLMAAFNVCWPARVIVAKTAAEKQDDLRQHMLLEKDLLQKQKLMDGREAYSHIVWVEKAF
ncbi:hypothetical protein H0H87_012090 [Tephrocybe sp. NHM501043]|nr:hypothetical protein H0H87_001798 [Tephrocybe sp. NHM501043]KAG6851826.1 hypothetical protein H0H87_012090 [Tephrocybe sp. NHM501043]